MELILQILFISNIDLHGITKNNIDWDQALKCSVQHWLFSTNNVVRLVLLTLLLPRMTTTEILSFDNRCHIKQTSDEDKEKCKKGDY